jgi:uncharacterized protein
MKPLTFTPAERLILANQYRILEHLFPHVAAYGEARNALERGYVRHYNRAAPWLSDDELTESEATEVLQILEMYSTLKLLFKQLPDTAGIDAERIEFPGFSGNEESKQLGYTRFYCELDGRRYSELSRRDYFDSHYPMLGTYRAMLKEWLSSKNRHRLTKDDIIRIISKREP